MRARVLATTFVGNSALYRDLSETDPERLRRHIGVAAVDDVLLILPGSRAGGDQAADADLQGRVREACEGATELKLVLPVAETVAELVENAVAEWSVAVDILRGDQLKYDAMRAATRGAGVQRQR